MFHEIKDNYGFDCIDRSMILPSITTPSKFGSSDLSKSVNDCIEITHSFNEVENQASNLYIQALTLEPHMYTKTINGHFISSQGNGHVSKYSEPTKEINVLLNFVDISITRKKETNVMV